MADDYCFAASGPHVWRRKPDGTVKCKRCWLEAENPDAAFPPKRKRQPKPKGPERTNEEYVLEALEKNPEGLTADGISAWLDENYPRYDDAGQFHSWGHNSTSSYLILDTAEYPGKLIADGSVMPLSREKTGTTRNGAPARVFILSKFATAERRHQWLTVDLPSMNVEFLKEQITRQEKHLSVLKAKLAQSTVATPVAPPPVIDREDTLIYANA